MNSAQETYLKNFCETRGVDEETALQYAVVKEVMKALEKKTSDAGAHSVNIPMSANCS